MHILDLVENSTRAGARNVSIMIEEDGRSNLMTIKIRDDGKGMSADEVSRVMDPFYTTKTERPTKVGLGIPMMRRTAEQCGGEFRLWSAPGRGTRVRVTMQLDHIDRPPMGDFNETLRILIAGNPGTDFDVTYIVDGEEEHFTTRGGGLDQDQAGLGRGTSD